jgi:cell filamentation protein
MNDPYLDPDSGVLRNRFGLKDQKSLDAVERELSSIGLDEIDVGSGPERTFDRAHLQAIHRQIFGEVYEWAGAMRDEKPLVGGEKLDPVGVLSKGGSAFLHASRIDMGLAEAFSHISDREALRAGSREALIEKAGNTLGDLNYIHPFREGNGRTQRAFIEELGRETGHDVDFRGITRERMISASIEVTADPSSDAMRHVVRDAVDPDRRDALRKVRGMLVKAGLDPDERYVVSARDGERIEGQIAWRGTDHAHVVTGQRLVVVNAADIPKHEDESREVAFTASPFSSAFGDAGD